jgi:hypothetical protein
MPELLLGCGNRREKQLWRDGNPLDENGAALWSDLTRLDHDPNCQPDVLHDLEKLPYPFEDNTFDELHAYHILEHVGQQGDWRFFFDQFTELWRITKPDGLLFGVVPHSASAWVWGDPSHTRSIQSESLLFLDQKSYENVGKSTMSDFRHYYKASWELRNHKVEGEEYLFILQAKKPTLNGKE